MNTHYKRTFIALAIIVAGACALLFHIIYKGAENAAIEKLHEEQMIHAKQSARGIEDFFAMWTQSLNSLSKMDEIIDNDAAGKRYMKLFYEANQKQIMAITRLDEKGVIIHNFPQNNFVGTDISDQRHVRELLRDHKPVISDVFKAVEGVDAVALHVPVFRGSVFKGTVGILINFEVLAKRYLDVIKIGETGYAWVVSRDGTKLYSPVPGFTGKYVYETIKDSPSLIDMVNDMLKGHEGAAQYTFDRIAGLHVGQTRKYAVYMPIHIGNTFWSIAVTSAEKDVLSGLIAFRNKLALVIGFLFICGMAFSTLGAKPWFIVKEEEKRNQAEKKLRETERSAEKLTANLEKVIASKDSLQKEIAERKRAEEALRESEKKYRSLIETANEGIIIGGIDGKIDFVNYTMANMLGYPVEDMVGRAGLDFMPGDQKEKVFANRVKLADKKYLKDEVCFLRKDGSRLWTIGSYAPIVDDKGVHIGNLGMYTDITERKKYEAILQESEARYRNLVRYAPAGIYEVDFLTGHFTEANDVMCQLLGYTRDELLSMTAFDILDDEGKARFASRVRQTQSGEQMDESVEYRVRTKDGRFIWGFLNVTFRWNEDKIVGATVVAHDITVRKQAEETVKRLNAELEKRVLEAESVNLAQKASRRAALNLIEDAVAARKKAEKAEKNLMQLSHELEKKVEERTAELKGTNELLRLEIIERAKAEESLAKRQQVLESIYAIETTFSASIEDIFDQVAVTVANILNVPYAAVGRVEKRRFAVLSQLTDGNISHEKSLPVAAHPCGIVARENKARQYTGNLLVLFPEHLRTIGHEYKSYIGIPISDKEGVLIGVICAMGPVERTCSDLELHSIEIFARYLGHEIEHEIMDSQLRIAGEMNLLGRIASGVAHEVRNPLNGILAISEALFQDLGDRPEHLPYLQHIKTQVNRLASLMRDLLDLGKPLAQSEFSPQPLAQIIRSAIDSLRHSTAHKNRKVNFKPSFEASRFCVKADSVKLQQVFFNLIDNACDHSPSDESITIEMTGFAEAEAVVRVIDKGKGILPELLEKVFEPFFSTRKGGTGLGLSIVKRIVELHGGTVSITNNDPPPGLTVEVRLPFCMQQDPAEK